MLSLNMFLVSGGRTFYILTDWYLVGDADAGVVPGRAGTTERTHGESVPTFTHLLPTTHRYHQKRFRCLSSGPNQDFDLTTRTDIKAFGITDAH